MSEQSQGMSDYMSIVGKQLKTTEEVWSETREQEYILSKEPREIVVTKGLVLNIRQAIVFVDFQLLKNRWFQPKFYCDHIPHGTISCLIKVFVIMTG